MFKRYISLNGELKIIFISIEILMSLSIVSQNSQFINKTYYYRQVLKVHNDQKDKGDNSGQFICFNDKGCYDADKSGYTVDNGFLEYNGNDNGYQKYSGYSFWGQATYYFTLDYNRLNVRLSANNIVYVYERTTPPHGIETCSKIKRNTNNQVTTNIPISSPLPISPNNNGGSEMKLVTVKCPLCNGTGYRSTPESVPSYGNTDQHWCSYCNMMVSASHGGHSVCVMCNGKGTVQHYSY